MPPRPPPSLRGPRSHAGGVASGPTALGAAQPAAAARPGSGGGRGREAGKVEPLPRCGLRGLKYRLPCWAQKHAIITNRSNLQLHAGITPRQAPAVAGRPASPPPPPPPRRSSPPGQRPTSQAPSPPQQAPAASQRPTAQHHTPQAQQHCSQGALRPSDAPIVSSRQWLLGLVPRQQFRVVGVSFDDRQSLIPLLQKGERGTGA